MIISVRAAYNRPQQSPLVLRENSANRPRGVLSAGVVIAAQAVDSTESTARLIAN